MMDSSELINKASARLGRITPGPWYQSGPPWDEDGTIIYSGSGDPHAGKFLATTDVSLVMFGDEQDMDDNATANAEFIADAPELVARLLAEVKRTSKQLEYVEICVQRGRHEEYIDAQKHRTFCRQCGKVLKTNVFLGREASDK